MNESPRAMTILKHAAHSAPEVVPSLRRPNAAVDGFSIGKWTVAARADQARGRRLGCHGEPSLGSATDSRRHRITVTRGPLMIESGRSAPLNVLRSRCVHTLDNGDSHGSDQPKLRP
jgi:hypothetical protein